MELVESRGDVVTRERLILRLWPKGVVGFDTGLNTAIRKLRVALGDTADTPRYIETLPRRGYRFIAALDAGPEPPSPQAPDPPKPPLPVDAPAGSGGDSPAAALEVAIAPHPFAITSVQGRRWSIGFLVLLALTLAYFLADRFWLSRRPPYRGCLPSVQRFEFHRYELDSTHNLNRGRSDKAEPLVHGHRLF